MDIISKINKATTDAERILNKAYEDYHAYSQNAECQELYALRLQAAIVQFEFCSQMKQIAESNLCSFASKVKLKDFIHKVYEYNKTLRGSHINRICVLAHNRGLPALVTKLQESSRTWRKALGKIDSFKNIRNKTTGHYDPDIAKQVQWIESIKENDAFTAFETFLSYNMEVLKILKNICTLKNV
ncbi:MAG: hypothetical protein HY096_15630 [Nitrospinae bacterium]|nr:hypothetical protein [Nitrospinota bacterium]